MQGDAFTQTKNYVITGKVTDARTKEPIPGAVVKMQNSNFATSINGEGVFICYLSVHSKKKLRVKQ